jgi:hypothetical protein
MQSGDATATVSWKQKKTCGYGAVPLSQNADVPDSDSDSDGKKIKKMIRKEV